MSDPGSQPQDERAQQRQSPAEREAQVDQILAWVCSRLFDTAPPGWRRLDLKVTMASTVDDFVYTAIMQDGSWPPHEPPMEIRPAFADIRDLLYEPGLGTWFSVRLILNPPDLYRVDFNFDVDPVWDPPVDPEVYAQDFKSYPRSEENAPAWLRKALSARHSAERVRRRSQPMTGPAAIGFEEQGRHAHRIADQLIQTLPPGWEYAQVHFREIGDHVETNAIVHTVTATLQPWSPPQAVADRFHELREAMRGGQTAWYSAQFEIRFSGGHKLQMNRSDQPQWISPPPPEAYQEELRLSGSPENFPDWLCRHLSG